MSSIRDTSLFENWDLQNDEKGRVSGSSIPREPRAVDDLLIPGQLFGAQLIVRPVNLGLSMICLSPVTTTIGREDLEPAIAPLPQQTVH